MNIDWLKDKAYPLPRRRTAADFEGEIAGEGSKNENIQESVNAQDV
jgi:hypothetical protein